MCRKIPKFGLLEFVVEAGIVGDRAGEGERTGMWFHETHVEAINAKLPFAVLTSEFPTLTAFTRDGNRLVEVQPGVALRATLSTLTDWGVVIVDLNDFKFWWRRRSCLGAAADFCSLLIRIQQEIENRTHGSSNAALGNKNLALARILSTMRM
jgi:hypothetical protein